MDIGAAQMASTIAQGTTDYLGVFLPVGAMIIGLTLAFGVVEWLIFLISDLQQYRQERDSGKATGDFRTWKRLRETEIE